MIWPAVPVMAATAGGTPPTTSATPPTTKSCDKRDCGEKVILPPTHPGQQPSLPARKSAAKPASGVAPDEFGGGASFWVLQMNLCDSGKAACWHMNNGDPVPEAATLIRDNYPDVVSLNEMCTGDMQPLINAMQADYPGDFVTAGWEYVWDRGADGPIQCEHGKGSYIDAIIAHVAMDEYWSGSGGGIYSEQDGGNEERGYFCDIEPSGFWQACTTHLSSTDAHVAFDQCTTLLGVFVPDNWRDVQKAPTVVAGDLNMTWDGGADSAQNCNDAVSQEGSWFRKGDDDVQHVFATTNFGYQFTQTFHMEHTDHPALLVGLTYPDLTGKLESGVGMCMDVLHSGTADGTPVDLYTCNGTNAQKWTVAGDETLRAFGKCLTVTGGGTGNGAQVELDTCNGTPVQQWQPFGQHTLVNPRSGRCLDDPYSSTDPGTRLQLWDCNYSAAQQWTLPNT
jgi:endonuclease/exonuclease/phosphatase family metal-dependent hydrolase